MPRSLVLACLALSTLALAAAPDVLARLGRSEAEFKDDVYAAFRSGHPWPPPGCKAVPRAARVEVAKAAASLAATWLRSADFAQRWEQDWAADEPQAPATPEALAARRADEAKANAAEQQRVVAEMKARAAAEQNPQVKQALLEAVAAQAQMAKQLETAEYRQIRAQAEQAAAAAEREAYVEQRAAYEQAHGAWQARRSARALVKQRLAEFRALAATVDFKAKTVDAPGVTRFVDPALEAKSGEWKLLFRLGPEVVAALRAKADELDRALQGP